MRDERTNDKRRRLKIELLIQWKLEPEFRNNFEENNFLCHQLYPFFKRRLCMSKGKRTENCFLVKALRPIYTGIYRDLPL